MKADFICCRHALEHIPEPVAFLRTVRRAIGENGTAVFFEVPNVMYTLRDLGIWDIIYEHCCYFSAASLARCFTAAGFAIERVDETYDGQFLTIEARPACGKPESGLHGRGRAAESEVGCRCASSSTAEAEASASGRPNGPSEVPSPGGASAEAVMQAARTFRTRFDEKLSTWQRQFGEFAATGQRAVIWGAGSKGVTILNMLKVTAGLEPVEYVVDINPRKQGRFAAGTGQQIVSPSFLRDYGPDIVVVMNAVYVDEIRTLVHKLGLDPALWKV